MKEEHAENTLQKSLKARHAVMIAIGGTIGIGTFVSTAGDIYTAGPGGALLALVIVGLALYFVMSALGEMTTHLPSSGGFSTYSTRYIDPAFGFATGWSYWFSCAFLVSSQMVTANTLTEHWFSDSTPMIWGLIIFSLILGANLFSAKLFARTSFWLVMIKIVTIIAFLVAGSLLILASFSYGEFEVSNWIAGDAPFVGGGRGTFNILLIVGFLFVGMETVSITSGESSTQDWTIPKSFRRVFWIVFLLHLGLIIMIGTTFAHEILLPRDDSLNSEFNVFTMLFSWTFLMSLKTALITSLVNAVLLTVVLTFGSSMLYSGSRLLYSMSKLRQAPRALGKVSKHSVPIIAVVVTASTAFVLYLLSFIQYGVFYYCLFNVTALTGYLTWWGICVSHLRFRKAFKVQQRAIDNLQYRSKFFPFGTWYSLIVCTVIILGQGFYTMQSVETNFVDIIAAYTGLPVFATFYVSYKVYKNTKIIAYEAMDLNIESETERKELNERISDSN